MFIDSSGHFVIALIPIGILLAKAIGITVVLIGATAGAANIGDSIGKSISQSKSKGFSTPANPNHDKYPNRKHNVNKNESKQWKKFDNVKNSFFGKVESEHLGSAEFPVYH